MVCITLFPASNCILSASSSRREEREALKFLSLVFQYDRKDRSDHLETRLYAHLKMNSKNCAQCYSNPCVSALDRYYKRRFLTQQCCVDKLTLSHGNN